MPKKPIDYSRTKMYKLVCKDISIIDCYVGSTTDMVDRKYCHKARCTNPDNKRYDTPVYKFIRATGGWSNWDMILIEDFPCKSNLEKFKRERELLELQAKTINAYTPILTDEERRLDHNKRQRIYLGKKIILINSI
jgi:hypothetical protein